MVDMYQRDTQLVALYHSPPWSGGCIEALEEPLQRESGDFGVPDLNMCILHGRGRADFGRVRQQARGRGRNTQRIHPFIDKTVQCAIRPMVEG